MSKLLKILHTTFPYPIWLRIYYLKKRKHLANLKSYCFFIGYPRSGHTLIGALVDSHPNTLISIEANVFNLLQKGYNRDQIFSYIIRRNNFFYKKKKGTWTGYNYTIDGLWQNSFKEINLIGDKKGSASTRILTKYPELLEKLQNEIQLPLKIIHVVRNPFDMISTDVLTRAKNYKIDPEAIFDDRIDIFIKNAGTNHNLITTHAEMIHTMRHEELITNPVPVLEKLFKFLDLPYDDAYFAKLKSMIFRKPNITRHKLEWKTLQIEKVLKTIDKFDFLHGYDFNS